MTILEINFSAISDAWKIPGKTKIEFCINRAVIPMPNNIIHTPKNYCTDKPIRSTKTCMAMFVSKDALQNMCFK